MAEGKELDEIHAGHRERVKKEFLVNGAKGLPDHRLLELLLFFVIRRGDVNPLAHRLLNHFGSLAWMFRATHDQLMQVEGVGPSTALLLRVVSEIVTRYVEDSYKVGEQLLTSWQFRDQLAPLFFGQRNELAYLVCMDGGSRLISTRKLGEGITGSVQITARKVLETALSCNATRVVLAHNHLSGMALWSDADLDTTLRLKRVLREAGLELVDHCIFADGDMVSMADSGVLRD